MMRTMSGTNLNDYSDIIAVDYKIDRQVYSGIALDHLTSKHLLHLTVEAKEQISILDIG